MQLGGPEPPATTELSGAAAFSVIGEEVEGSISPQDSLLATRRCPEAAVAKS